MPASRFTVLLYLNWENYGFAGIKAHLEHFLKPIWIPFIIEPLLASDAKKLLERLARRRLASLAQDFETIFSPDEPNAISRERAGLLKLAIAIKMGQAGGKHIAAALREHAGLYGFIPCYDVIDKPWTVTHFQQELKVLLRHSKEDLRQELGGLETVCAKRQQLFRALLVELKPAKRERELLLMAHELAFIKDERDDYRRRMSFAIQPLFAELGRRAQVPSRATLYFIQRELTEWFQSGKLPVARRSLLERMKGYCLVKMGAEPIQIFSGRAMAEFLKTQKFREERTGQREIRGIIGNRGVARGPARIIFTKYDLRKVRPGDIMVAVTTHPDFVPAMRQCRAFVTDEGGITSHAAIVARELKLPCVVGTKNASKFLKDGEQVEVDADHGWVRKI